MAEESPRRRLRDHGAISLVVTSLQTERCYVQLVLTVYSRLGGEPSENRSLQCVTDINFISMFMLPGVPDPFVRISIGAESYSTKAAKGTLSPVWNQSFTMYVLHETLFYL